MTIENKGAAVFIPVGIVALNFDDFRDKAPARPPFQMHHYIDRVTDICFDGAIRQGPTTLQHTTCETRQALLSRKGREGGKTCGGAGVSWLSGGHKPPPPRSPR